MNHYSDETRGELQMPEKAKQKLLFSGMNFEGQYGIKNVTPTDIDGYIQLEAKDAFIFIETKFKGADIPYGQKLALTRLADELQNAGVNAIVIHTEHTVENGDIPCENTITKSYYCNKKWFPGKPEMTCMELITKFIEFASKRTKAFVVKDKETGTILNTPLSKYLLSDDGVLVKRGYSYEEVKKEGKLIIEILDKTIIY